MKYRLIKDFMPRVLAYVDGADPQIVKAFISDAVIQFLRDTKLTSEEVCLDIDPCIHSYKIKTRLPIMEILQIKFFVGGRRYPSVLFSYTIKGNTFYFDYAAAVAGKIRVELEVLTYPPRDSEKVPAIVYEEWQDAIAAYALYKLFLMPNTDWTSTQAAGIQLEAYNKLRMQALVTRVSKGKPMQVKLLNKRKY